MRVLVAGGTGFVGSHPVKAPSDAGTASVLGAAHERGLDPIIHVAGNAALIPGAR